MPARSGTSVPILSDSQQDSTYDTFASNTMSSTHASGKSYLKKQSSPSPSIRDAPQLHCCVGAEDEDLLKRETEARQKTAKNPVYLILINFYATHVIFILYLLSCEMIVSVALSAGLTVYVFRVVEVQQIGFDGGSMSLTLLSFAVISPITATITMAFNRRENALAALNDLRATLLELYCAHAVWDWGQKPGVTEDSGRIKSTVNWLEHSDAFCLEVLMLVNETTRMLTLPNTTRARHKTTRAGRREAKRTDAVAGELYLSLVRRVGRLAEFCEILKREGLPPNEATRVRQYERYVLVDLEKLRVIKAYRTPQGLRSFGRLFSVFLPPFFAPLFADIAERLNSLGMGIAFAVVTAVALTGLFETLSQFEDPFLEASVLDGARVAQELVVNFTPEILALREQFFPKAPPLNETQLAVQKEPKGELLPTSMRIINNDQ